MSIVRLDHFNIRAPQRIIDEVIVFYKTILGLIPGQRPYFGIDGAWLYDGDYPMVHLAVDEAATAPGENEHLNHIAFQCQGLEQYLNRLTTAKIPYTDNYVPELEMTQLFFYDPAGIYIEMDFLNEKIC